MENTTQIVLVVLAAYGNIDQLRHLYFSIVIIFYIAIVVANSVLILVICVEKPLHEPMYLFLCSLFANELYGSTAVLPFIMTQMLSDKHDVPASHCFLQIFTLYTYASVEYCNLAAMAYDRYVSICYPLHYNVIMTTRRVNMIILLVWTYSFIKFTITVPVTVSFKFCDNIIDKVYCDIWLLNKLACSVSTFNGISIYVVGFLTVGVPLIPISFSYIKILSVCLKTSKETKQKAINTCTPHIASLVNFTFACFFDILQSRFDITWIPAALRIILSVYLLICQPLLSPIMYGLHISKIRNVCQKFLVYIMSQFHF
ncbi:olfactory receptor 4B13-like [Centroberyx affinis]|uniref:olfactory receptor 4B13-like n=1 Tax=Centroberyx affinis TaxID=166261 RepID=UPI003A5C0CC9